MNVLMISGDRHLLEEETEAGKRLALQRSAIERLDVFVWPQVHSRRQILTAANAGAYDVVTVQDPFWRGVLGLWAARVGNAKFNVQVHADLSAQPLLRRVIARVVLRRADSIRVVSEKIKQQVLKTETKATVQVLPVFVDIAPFQTVVQELHEGKVILWVGRFETEKNPTAAISILRHALDAGVTARLIFLGSGSLETQLRTLAAGLPVEFPGWRPAQEYLGKADVVLCTSRHESWGASIVEALAAGVPVVSPDVGVAREAGALVVEQEALADKVVEVLRAGARGELKLHLPSAGEWAKQWKESL